MTRSHRTAHRTHLDDGLCGMLHSAARRCDIESTAMCRTDRHDISGIPARGAYREGGIRLSHDRIPSPPPLPTQSERDTLGRTVRSAHDHEVSHDRANNR
jgi:hypothetical protein